MEAGHNWLSRRDVESGEMLWNARFDHPVLAAFTRSAPGFSLYKPPVCGALTSGLPACAIINSGRME